MSTLEALVMDTSARRSAATTARRPGPRPPRPTIPTGASDLL